MSHLAHIATMQPVLVDEAPTGGDWIHEIKFDGYRTQLAIFDGAVRAYTRNGHDWTDRYGPIVQDAGQLPCISALIDGEMCVQDENGVTDFSALPGAMRHEQHRLCFFAFDLLQLDGVDLVDRPLEERRAKLRWLLSNPPGRISMSDEFTGDGPEFFKLADSLGLEGIVSKRRGSRYLPGENRAWLKTKCWHTDTFDVIGVERDRNGVPYALLAQGGGYKGTAFIALPAALRSVFWRFVDAKAVPAPIIGVRKKGATWLPPGMRATVRHLKGDNKLRHAVVKEVVIDDR